MHISNHILQPDFAHLFLALSALQAKRVRREKKNPAVLFVFFPSKAQESVVVGRLSPQRSLTVDRRASQQRLFLHQLPNYYCCCVYNFRGSHPLQSELIPRYWVAAWWKKLPLKSHNMWERDVQRASAGRRILTVCAHVWVGGERKGDICAANVAQV